MKTCEPSSILGPLAKIRKSSKNTMLLQAKIWFCTAEFMVDLILSLVHAEAQTLQWSLDLH